MKLETLEAIVRVLEDARVRYLVVGGLAVVAHGVGRLTFDVDLVVQLDPDNVARAMAALGRLDYRPTVPVSARDLATAEVRQRWIAEKHMIVLALQSDSHRETTIDIFVTEPFDFDLEYGRALVGAIAPGLTVRFVQVDTLKQMKLAAGRPKDLEDIRQLELGASEHDR